MDRWLDRLRFLWEEETAPPGVASPRPGRGNHTEPSGVPRPLQKAARFALIGVVATSLMSQIIEVRLIAPVDAAPSYVAQCIQANCKGLTGQERAACNHACQEAARNRP
jgi:hypothetical protein